VYIDESLRMCDGMSESRDIIVWTNILEDDNLVWILCELVSSENRRGQAEVTRVFPLVECWYIPLFLIRLAEIAVRNRNHGVEMVSHSRFRSAGRSKSEHTRPILARISCKDCMQSSVPPVYDKKPSSCASQPVIL
jgi:hypothetical protein